MYDFYTTPSGYCFDIICGDGPVVDDEDSPEYNLDKKVRNSKLNL